MTQRHITVIGGGVIGLVSAWRLAQSGYRVTLLEKGECGSGASCASVGALMPYGASRQDDLPLFQQKSLWMYPSFVKELFDQTGIDVGYKRSGRLQPISNEKQYENFQLNCEMAQKNWPEHTRLPVQEIVTQEQLKHIEPELEVGEYGALLCRMTAFIDVRALVSALKSACRRAQVDIIEECEVDPLDFKDGRVELLRTGHGPKPVDCLLIASGAWAGQICKDLPVEPLKGQVIQLSHDHLQLNHLIRSSGLYIVPKGYGKFLVGATKEKDAGFDLSIDGETADTLIYKAASIVPALAEAKIEKHWAGLRPQSSVGEPFIGQIGDKNSNVYAAVGHGGIGICLAPKTGEAVVEMFS